MELLLGPLVYERLEGVKRLLKPLNSLQLSSKAHCVKDEPWRELLLRYRIVRHIRLVNPIRDQFACWQVWVWRAIRIWERKFSIVRGWQRIQISRICDRSI